MPALRTPDSELGEDVVLIDMLRLGNGTQHRVQRPYPQRRMGGNSNAVMVRGVRFEDDMTTYLVHLAIPEMALKDFD